MLVLDRNDKRAALDAVVIGRSDKLASLDDAVIDRNILFLFKSDVILLVRLLLPCLLLLLPTVPSSYFISGETHQTKKDSTNFVSLRSNLLSSLFNFLIIILVF